MRMLLLIAAVIVLWLYLRKGMSQSARDVQPATSSPEPDADFGAGDNLDNIMDAIFRHEGGHSGQRNIVNNNPGNLKSAKGMTGKAGGFATFADQGDGWDALTAWLKSHAAAHPDWDFYDMFNYYLRGSTTAPTVDKQGDSDAYAKFVASAAGLDPTQPVSTAIGVA
jgi:hypothetical protein